MEADIREFESEVQDMLQRCGNIVRVGYQDKPEEFFAAMDIFVLPSYREGFSTAVLEASAMSLPVVSTDIPGSRNSPLDGEIGLLAPVKSIEGLKDALETLCKDSQLRNRMGQAGRLWAKKFEQRLLWNRIVEHRRNLLSKKKIPSGSGHSEKNSSEGAYVPR
jgi:glycosyltransferase involved in cell wall biosynthesis